MLDPKERFRKYSLRSVFDGILYIVKTGVQWRMLPSDFAPWQTVYYYFSKWKNEVMLEEIENYPPPSTKGKFIKIKYITQLPTPCPSFAFFCNLPQYIGAPYKRFLENKLRSHFDFTGCPIRIFMRQK